MFCASLVLSAVSRLPQVMGPIAQALFWCQIRGGLRSVALLRGAEQPAAPASIIAGLRLSRQRPDRAIQRPSDAHAPPARSWHGAARFGAARLDSGQAARSVALPATTVLCAMAMHRTRLSPALSPPPTDPGEIGK